MEISARELDVLALLGEHYSNAEISARLFISVRTVESHVSSLLRKLSAPDRRVLARRAVELLGSGPDPALPTPLTTFVGRARELAELTGMIGAHRQVTAVGPGGVGKTRLALAVAAAAQAHRDGVWFVDLVSTAEPAMVPAAVAAALGLGEQPGRSMADSVIAALADRRALLVLDNCEQVRDGVALFTERLLTGCPGLTVLATSRARLMVPFERVYPVPPLSLDGGGRSEAVALFLERAAAAGEALDPAVAERVATFCERLDGMALAIELAAARWPTLGADGLAAALSHPLRMLTGGSRADQRHRSVRAALDWSHALLDDADRLVLRRLSVFAAPFTAEAAAEVTGLGPGEVADGLARLAEQSLIAAPEAGRYRALETIRQYGAERLTEAGEAEATRARHLHWCLEKAAGLAAGRPGGRAAFDDVADELRAALTWAAEQPHRRAEAHRMARALAELTFTRNLIGESQQRYTQAAALADDPSDTAAMLRRAALAAGCRMLGEDMYRLHQEAAEAALRAGDHAAAAADLATAALAVRRFDVEFERVPAPAEAEALTARARELAGEDPAALAAVSLADAGDAVMTAFRTPGDITGELRDALTRAERAVALAERTGDPLALSAALDALTVARTMSGDAPATAATALRRVELLTAAPGGPGTTHELIDALGTVMLSALGTGDLPGARHWARRLAAHPLLAEIGHRRMSWLLVADALAGDIDAVVAGGARLLESWRRSGSPARTGLGPSISAVAMAHGLRGDDAAHAEWTAILGRLDASPWRAGGYGAVFEALLSLHKGHATEALDRMRSAPADIRAPITWGWLHWYAALRAEATVLAEDPGARDRLAEARAIVTGHPVATAVTDRAEALLDGDHDRLLATATAFDAAECRYQSARTLLLAGGEHAGRGRAALAALGVAPPALRG